MKHIILGTAGHIDHGKTTLVKALTDIDCDTHKEEKSRGITINLGFAHLQLPDGNNIGIVDVPGHSDFVNTMVAGASGIDIVMFVIAADSSVMPQTVEHLRIMEILGIKKGFVALTKTDLVSPDLLEMAEDEISELLKETFLESCPIIKVSVKDEYDGIGSDGIAEIKNALMNMIGEIEERKKGEIFRIFIDRIFTLKGHGSVITGSVLSGTVKKEDKIFLLPSEKELRIRRIERHGSEVDSVTAGDRASMNLVGLNLDDFERGMCLSDRKIKSTEMVDAKLTLFQKDKNFELWNHAIFILGTFQSQARIHLIDSDNLRCGETAVVQIHLDDPCIAQIGDRFVIRSTSGDFTLGGGEIIDAHPLHHRRRPEKLVKNLQRISDGGIPERIAAEVNKCLYPISLIAISEVLNISQKEAVDFIEDSLPNDIISLEHEGDYYLMSRDENEKLEKKILKNLENYHKRNPLDEGGRNIDELLGIFGAHRNSVSEIIVNIILTKLQNENLVKKAGRTWALVSHNVKLTGEEKKQIKFIENYLINSGMATPLLTELNVESKKYNIDENQLKQILQMLVNQKKAYNIEGNFIHSTIIDKSRQNLLEYLEKHDEGITVAQFRDLVNGNRKICLLMFTQFDSEGITIRSDDFRLITKKGKEKLEELE
ncbi:selenocysteine-specific translation elongation factor [Bacteroidota bacterium]